MHDAQEGLLLMGTAMIVFIVFLVTVLGIMLIYRKRKLDHIREVTKMNEHFSHELLQAQLEVQERTMQDIGRDIHDNVGQQLTLASLYAQSFDTPAGFPEIREKMDNIAHLINNSLADLRGLSKELTDPGFFADDLVALMKKEVKKISALGICGISFATNTDPIETNPGVKNFIFRVLQEFIQNSLKHAACSRIDIGFFQGDNDLRISARDDGKGFDLLNPVNLHGMGLTNMKKRASLIGSFFSLESASGKGTQLYLVIPQNKLT